MATGPIAPNDPQADISFGTITTVQLVAGLPQQRNFLKKLQVPVAGKLSINSLNFGNSNNVFVIPMPLEEALRADPSRSSRQDWDSFLRNSGALTVNISSAEAVLALMRIGVIQRNLNSDVIPKTSVAPKPPPKAPVDARLPKQFQGPFDWHLGPEGCNIVGAWRIFSNEPQFANALPWAQIKVGHIDTGYSEHVALGWEAGTSTTVRPRDGYDYFRADVDPRDEFIAGSPGHGTRISSTIAGFFPTAKTSPFYGVAPGAQIVPYRVTDCVWIEHVKMHVVSAIDEAIADGCHAINISLGAGLSMTGLAEAIDRAYLSGVIVSCAAGNVVKDVVYPGRYNRCITVGGIGPDSTPWAGGSCGPYVDLCGPADQLRRVKPENLPVGSAGSQVEPKLDGDGTSYATAMATGIAALWLAFHGVDKLKVKYGSDLWKIPRAFKALLRQSARVPAGWDTSHYGTGIMDAEALLRLPLPDSASLKLPKSACDVFDPND